MPRPMTDTLIRQVLHRSADAHGVLLSLGSACCDSCAAADGRAELCLAGDFGASFVVKSGEAVIDAPLTFTIAPGRREEAARSAMNDVAGALRLDLAAASQGGLTIVPRP